MALKCGNLPRDAGDLAGLQWGEMTYYRRSPQLGPHPVWRSEPIKNSPLGSDRLSEPINMQSPIFANTCYTAAHFQLEIIFFFILASRQKINNAA